MPTLQTAEPQNPVLDAKGLGFAYPGTTKPVLSGFGFAIYPQDQIALVGPSGCGKTTLLRVLEGSLQAQAGSVQRQGRVALVYQDHRLVAEDTVLANVRAGALREAHKTPLKETNARAKALLADVGLAGLESRRVSELSGGQKQRVALARALCSRPDVLLADEPFANLDRQTASTVADLLARLQQKHGFALVASVHDPHLADQFKTQVDLCDPACLLCPAQEACVLKPQPKQSPYPAYLLAAALATLAVTALLRFAPELPALDSALRESSRLLAMMVPRSLQEFATLPWPTLLAELLATAQMALLGTLVGVLLSLPLALVATLPDRAATNKNLLARALPAIALSVANVVRSVPAILWALLFVAALGIGPVAGIAALAAYSVGYLTRLFTETIENTDPRPAQALIQLGASRWQALRHGILKPALPGLAGAAFFVFEYNIRGASVLGIVGAGGIGAQLAYYLEWRQLPAFAAGLALIVTTAILLDAVSRRVRQRLAAARGH